MDVSHNWEMEFVNEIQHAEAARSAGNEGMCRVCARRAAGCLAGEYLSQQGMKVNNLSAFQRLRHLKSLPNLPARIGEILEHMTTQVNHDHQLSPDVDLISEAIELRDALLGETKT